MIRTVRCPDFSTTRINSGKLSGSCRRASTTSCQETPYAYHGLFSRRYRSSPSGVAQRVSTSPSALNSFTLTIPSCAMPSSCCLTCRSPRPEGRESPGEFPPWNQRWCAPHTRIVWVRRSRPASRGRSRFFPAAVVYGLLAFGRFFSGPSLAVQNHAPSLAHSRGVQFRASLRPACVPASWVDASGRRDRDESGMVLLFLTPGGLTMTAKPPVSTFTASLKAPRRWSCYPN